MNNSITSTAGVGDHPQGSPQRDREERDKPTHRPPEPLAESDPAEFRLIIESGEGLGSFVYKTIDARTGQVVRQIPREELLGMGERTDYHAGDVIRARA